MKCDVCQSNIEDYFDGELRGKLAASVTAHLSGCKDCSGLFQELKQEQELYARYQRDVEVTPALWAAVEARIKQDKAVSRAPELRSFRERLGGMFGGVFHTPRLSPAFAAALVIVTIGATVVVMNLLNSRVGDGNQASLNGNRSVEVAGSGSDNANSNPGEKKIDPGQPSIAAEPEADKRRAPSADGNQPIQKQLVAKRPAPPRVTPDQLVREAQQKYITAIAILSRDVNHRRSQIDPMVLARFDNALANIDRTIQETRRAVREHPDDPIALQYLLAAYSKKVDVLRDMAAEGQ
jgi:Putative zinc-finger